jgi:hypothetical protein
MLGGYYVFKNMLGSSFKIVYKTHLSFLIYFKIKFQATHAWLQNLGKIFSPKFQSVMSHTFQITNRF